MNEIVNLSKRQTFNFLLDNALFNALKTKLNLLLDRYLTKTEDFTLFDLKTDSTSQIDIALNWLIRSKSNEARYILQDICDKYEELDWSIKKFSEREKITFDACRERVKQDLLITVNKKEVWDHEGHYNIIRNKNMLLRYDRLSKSKEYFDQPINIVLPVDYYRRNLSALNVQQFNTFLEVAGVFENIKPTTMAKNFGDITSLVKKYRQDKYGDRWYDLCDLGTIFGYNMKSQVSEMTQELEDWYKYKEPKRPRDINYIKESKYELDQLFRLTSTNNKITLEEFIRNAHLWIVAGSSNGIKDMVWDRIDKVERKSASKKIAIFTTMSTNNIIQKVLDDKKQPSFIPNVKIELGMKDRLIIAGGNWEYLRMAYVSHHIERLLAASRFSPFYSPSSWRYDNYSEKVSYMKLGYIMLPLDSKSFDKWVLSDEINVVFDVFVSAIEKFFNNDNVKKDMLKVMSLIKKSFNVHGWSVLVEGKVRKWENGVPSGIRWTTLIDSLVNFMRAKVLSKYIKKKWGLDVLKHVAAAGDDDDFVCESWFGAYLMFKTYEIFNIPVHASKNFVANDVTEFLKNLVTKDGKLIGYKARKVANLFFVSPEKQAKPAETYDDINFSVYDACTRRGLKVVDELNQDNNWMKLGFAPRVLGGFGNRIDLTKPFDSNLSRRLLKAGRFKLADIKHNTSLKQSTDDVDSFMKSNNLNYDRKRFIDNTKVNIGSSLAPKGHPNILEVLETKIIQHSNPVELSDEELFLRISVGRGLKYLRKFQVKQELSWLDYRTLMTTVDPNDLFRYIESIIHIDCQSTYNKLMASTDNIVEKKHKLNTWINPRYEYKVPYTKNYSIEFLADKLGDIMDRLTIKDLIDYNTITNPEHEKTVINRMIGVEYSLGRWMERLYEGLARGPINEITRPNLAELLLDTALVVA